MTSATLTLNLNQTIRPFPHYWERCVGSCHAATALRQDWREQLKRCHDELGFEYVRFHGLLDDDMSICTQDWNGRIHYSFYNVDSIADFLLSIGMKPFWELSFMPTPLASGSKTVFHYRGNITPPKDYTAWGDLIYRLAAHLVDRYGLDETRRWFFEVWNEPNLSFFWAGTQAEYFELYRHAAQAIKAVDSQLPVGGPSTACNAWIPELRAYCQANATPLDFVSTHHYPTDAALGHSMDMEAQMAAVPRGILHSVTAQARREAGDLPLYYTEWNNSPSSRDAYHDDPYAAAFAIKTIVDNQGLVDLYSFWTFSDIFEEVSLPSAPYHGGFGLLNLYGIPKPTYRAFELLHHLGQERLPVELTEHPTVEAVAVKRAGGVDLLIYNHHVPLAPIETAPIQVIIQGGGDSLHATVQRIDADHANPKRRWQELGSPEYPTPAALAELRRASEMPAEPLTVYRQDNNWAFDVAVPPHSVLAIHLEA